MLATAVLAFKARTAASKVEIEATGDSTVQRRILVAITERV